MVTPLRMMFCDPVTNIWSQKHNSFVEKFMKSAFLEGTMRLITLHPCHSYTCMSHLYMNHLYMSFEGVPSSPQTLCINHCMTTISTKQEPSNVKAQLAASVSVNIHYDQKIEFLVYILRARYVETGGSASGTIYVNGSILEPDPLESSGTF